VDVTKRQTPAVLEFKHDKHHKHNRTFLDKANQQNSHH
jgi:hypothetical protein